MRILLILVFGFFMGITANSQVEAILAKAQSAIIEKDYKACIGQYQLLLDEEYQSEDLFFNLGHCYYNDDQLAKAVLYYNKVLKHNEYHQGAINNLEIVNDQRASEISELPDFFLRQWWDAISGFLGAGQWAILFLLSLMASLYFFWKWLNISQSRKYFMTLLIGVFVLMMLFFSLGFSKYQRTYQIKHVVNMTETSIFKGPDKRSGEVTSLIAGERLKILDESMEWYKVSLANKEIGWINKSLVEGV